MNTWTILKDLVKKNCLIENVFFEVDLEYHDELYVLHNDNSLKTCNSL